MDKQAREILAKNIKRLMDHNNPRLTQTDLAKKSGVSQRTISNLLRPDAEISPTLANVEAVAQSFGLALWHLLVPDLPDDLLTSRSIEKVLDCYKEATSEGRATIERIAQGEMRYRQIENTQAENLKKSGG